VCVWGGQVPDANFRVRTCTSTDLLRVHIMCVYICILGLSFVYIHMSGLCIGLSFVCKYIYIYIICMYISLYVYIYVY